MSSRFERFLQRRITRAEARRLWHAAAWLVLAGLAGGIFLFFYLVQSLPTPTEINNRAVAESTKVYDRTGTILLYEISAGKRRTIIPLGEMPQFIKDATIAIEDKDFYNEPAFSMRGIARAVVANLTHGGAVQGASTITQQLARNAFLSPERTLTRKLRELILAIQLDRQYTKDKILEMYLNEIPYGPQLYGIEAASRAYFSKPAENLSLSESAILAALPQAPSRLSPWGNHMDELLARQRLVLRVMRDQGKINETQYQAALAERPVFASQDPYGIKAPHFVLAVQDYLLNKYGEDALRNGGLKVKTTLDWDLQQAAEKAVASGAARNEELYGGGNAALVAEDAKTGQLLALVGSRDYFDKEHEGSYNVAVQGLRQPGSALKPFVYLAGFVRGYTPETILFDVATEFSANSACPAVPDFNSASTRCFHPQDFDETFRGPVNVRTALAQSINIPAVKMLYLVGVKNAVQVLGSFGVTTLNKPDQYGLSLVLGGGAVHLMELVKAYSVLSQDGVLRDQSIILEIRDKTDQVLESYKESETQVMEAEPIRQINDILSDVSARAGLFHSSLNLTVFPGHDVALKTGTSNDYRDAWTVGYTPSLVVGVWAGNNNNEPMHRHGSSILAAVPIWHDFMSEALKNEPYESFTAPGPSQSNKSALVDFCRDANGAVHTILFCVDPSDPTGPPLPNPRSNSQYDKWEDAVQRWLSLNPISPPAPEPSPTSSEVLPPGSGAGSGEGEGFNFQALPF